MGGYSTADGFMGQVSVSERNLLGTGRYARASLTAGQYIRGVEFNFVEPYFLDYRMSAGIDLFARQTLASPYLSYGTSNYGTNLKFGIPLREDLTFAIALFDLRAANLAGVRFGRLHQSQPELHIDLPDTRCARRGFARRSGRYPRSLSGLESANFQSNCLYANNSPIYVAALPIREELSYGTEVDFAAGIRIDFNTLDNNKRPTNGLLVNFGQDIRRPWRRRLISAYGHRFPQLLRNRLGSRRRPASARRRHDRLAEMSELRQRTPACPTMATCACSTTSRWVRTSSAVSSRPAWARAT